MLKPMYCAAYLIYVAARFLREMLVGFFIGSEANSQLDVSQ